MSIFLLFLGAVAFANGNGSSTIGNPIVMLNNDFSTTIDVNKFEVRSDAVVAKGTGAEILKYRVLSLAEAEREKAKSIPAQIGMIKGWEFEPLRGEKGKNSWVLCSSSCWSFEANQEKGLSAAAILGGISKNP